jgi:Ca2+-binding RTX toxin-like protein
MYRFAALRAGARRWVVTAGLVAALACALAFPAVAARDDLILVSRTTGGAAADGGSFSPAISADGRFVAVESGADNLSTGDNNTFTNIFVRDLQASTTTLASITFDNSAGANDNASNPSISADGRFVALASSADNLSTGDNNSFSNIFVRDLQGSTTTLASVTFDNSAGANDDSFDPEISADGHFVAFQSGADNLSTGDNNTFPNIFVRDLQASTTTLASVTFDNSAGANDGSFSPAISADGRFVAFSSSADNLAPDDNNAVLNVFVRDTQPPGTTTLVSRAAGPAGAGADGGSSSPAISADGRFVAFSSGADNLSAEDDNNVQNVFVRDLVANTTTLVSRASGAAGAGANDGSSDPAISAEGRFVVFGSGADNLSGEDNNDYVNVFVRDLVANTTSLVSRAAGPAGAGASNHSGLPAISGVARFVAFESEADNLSVEDNDNVTNVFARDVFGPVPGSSFAPASPGRRGGSVAGARCAGRPATLVGTAARDTLRGTPGRDVIASLAGDDLVIGRGGADVICLGPGGDRGRGEGGADLIDGGPGNDRLLGGSGRDRLLGRGGRDLLIGGPGGDLLIGGLGRDRLLGGAGPDRLLGGAGRDSCAGGTARLCEATGR